MLRKYIKELLMEKKSEAVFPDSYFKANDEILFGKYKNKRGKIVRFGIDEKGNPFVEIEPIPKGRKKNVIMGLFKIWRKKKED